MLQIFHDINIDWLGKRRFFIGISIVLMLAGMGTAFYRHKFHPNGTEAFNLGAISLRLGGKRLLWDAANMKVTNIPEANKFLTREYRPGWQI